MLMYSGIGGADRLGRDDRGLSIAHAPVVYLAAPSKPQALQAHPDRRTIAAQTFRKLVQGGGAAMLAYAGAGSIANASSANLPILSDFSNYRSLEGMAYGLTQGVLTGPAQLIAGGRHLSSCRAIQRADDRPLRRRGASLSL